MPPTLENTIFYYSNSRLEFWDRPDQPNNNKIAARVIYNKVSPHLHKPPYAATLSKGRFDLHCI